MVIILPLPIVQECKRDKHTEEAAIYYSKEEQYKLYFSLFIYLSHVSSIKRLSHLLEIPIERKGTIFKVNFHFSHNLYL